MAKNYVNHKQFFVDIEIRMRKLNELVQGQLCERITALVAEHDEGDEFTYYHLKYFISEIGNRCKDMSACVQVGIFERIHGLVADIEEWNF